MLESTMSQSYAPVEGDEETMAFVPEGQTYTAYNPVVNNTQNSNFAAAAQPMNSTTNMALQGVHRNSSVAPTTSAGASGIEIVTAVPIPNTIRPPKLAKQIHPSVQNVKKMSIFLVGTLMAYICYYDAQFFVAGDYHKTVITAAIVFWSLAALALVVGTVLGVMRGEWRMLAPGIILSYGASYIMRLFF